MQVQANADKWKYCWLFEVGNMRNGHLKTIRKLWKEWAPSSAELFSNLDTFLVAPVECFLGEVPSWRKDWATPSRKSIYQACTYCLGCAFISNRFIQALIFMSSTLRVKSASSSQTPLQTK